MCVMVCVLAWLFVPRSVREAMPILQATLQVRQGAAGGGPLPAKAAGDRATFPLTGLACWRMHSFAMGARPTRLAISSLSMKTRPKPLSPAALRVVGARAASRAGAAHGLTAPRLHAQARAGP